MTIRPLGAQISHMLKDRGIDVIFGIPGVHNQEMYRGIEEAGITHVLARHEQGAGFMADGYARASNKPGVCYVITGPGVLNALTPMGQAYSDSVPVLMLASCLDEIVFEKGQLHQMRDQEGAAESVTDWSVTARTVDAVYGLIDFAFTEFATKRKRPKAIHVPIKLLEAESSMPPNAVPERNCKTDDTLVIGDIADLLQNAERPLIIAGGGCVGADEALRIVTQVTGAASFSTYAGRGVFAHDDPLHFGSNLSRAGSQVIIGQADVVFAIGTELAEVDIWRSELGHTGTFIRVDIDPEMLTSRPRTDVALCADASITLIALMDKIHREVPTKWTAAEVVQARSGWRLEIEVERPGLPLIIDTVRAAMPDNAMIYSDMTGFAYAAQDIWPMKHAGHWHHPFGFGTLGYALPASIGGAVARKDRPTVCIIGDYGLQYTIAELGTAVELGLPLAIILWDNGKLGEIENSMISAQIPPNAVIQRNPDFLALARAYGALAAQPATLSDIAPALDAAFKANVPTLIRLTPELAT
ncbi:MAG: 5-guanidino-2-oxopentanoate decarboxylase [Octadecabacter sp.]|nr:5-guanidino-2-oxopentanoate decarboxylase [Octadecabacter sp.]